MTPGVRLRGRAGQAARKRRLARHPLCAMCLAAGFVTPTREIDHVVRLDQGGSDVDENVQGLCLDCHRAKTAAESSGGKGAANHPLWLRPAAIPVVIVCGPPGGGKSTFVEAHAKPGDIVIDLDTIRADVLRLPASARPPGTEGLDAAVRIRNAMLGKLASASGGRAFFIVGAPAPAERQWWRNTLGPLASVVVCNPGEREAVRRVLARSTPYLVAAVGVWFRREREPWSPPVERAPRPFIRADGRPIGWGD